MDTASKALRKALQDLRGLAEQSRDGFAEGRPYILTYSDIIERLKELEALTASASPAGRCTGSIPPHQCVLEQGHYGEHEFGIPAGSGASGPPTRKWIDDTDPLAAMAEAVKQPQPPAAVPSERARCNYYFGGFDGGNRCQLDLEHGDGHQWRADCEAAIRAEAERGGK